MSRPPTVNQVLKKLKDLSSPRVRESMARFAIPTKNALGVSVPALRKLSRHIGKNHALAADLWKTGLLEARVLAALLDEPAGVTEAQAERWAKDFDFWGVCDACCGNVFDKTPFAYRKAAEWSRRKEEFVKRAGFALMAALAVHDKQADDAKFLKFLPIIRRESIDERNFVRKAVNWALRQIGKRNPRLHRAAIRTAHEIRVLNSRSARWIAADALRELTRGSIQKRFRARS